MKTKSYNAIPQKYNVFILILLVLYIFQMYTIHLSGSRSYKSGDVIDYLLF